MTINFPENLDSISPTESEETRMLFFFFCRQKHNEIIEIKNQMREENMSYYEAYKNNKISKDECDKLCAPARIKWVDKGNELYRTLLSSLREALGSDDNIAAFLKLTGGKEL